MGRRRKRPPPSLSSGRTRIITRGAIRRERIQGVSVLLVILAAAVFYFRIGSRWNGEAIRVPGAYAAKAGQDDKGRQQWVLGWSVNGRRYNRLTVDGPANGETDGGLELRYLPDHPERALTWAEADGEAEQVAFPALIAFGLALGLPYALPAREDDDEIVSQHEESATSD